MSYSDVRWPMAPLDERLRCGTCRHLAEVPGEAPPHDLECKRPIHPRGLVTREWGCLDHEVAHG